MTNYEKVQLFNSVCKQFSYYLQSDNVDILWISITGTTLSSFIHDLVWNKVIPEESLEMFNLSEQPFYIELNENNQTDNPK